MVKNSGSIDLKCRLDLAVSVPPCVLNATERCADCYEGLATRTDEVNVRFMALLDLFTSAQSRVSGEKQRVH